MKTSEKIVKPRCPKCDSLNVYHRLKLDNWVCRICGKISERDEVMPLIKSKGN
jgi:ribosomal protein L37AE/L43A